METTRGTKLLVKVEWVRDSGNYVAACTINTDRSFQRDATLISDSDPDCEDLDGVAWETNDKDILSCAVAGAGKLHKSDVHLFEAWHESKDPKRCKIVLDDDDAANVITRSGEFHLTNYTESGAGKGQKVTAAIALKSTGAVTSAYGANVGG